MLVLARKSNEAVVVAAPGLLEPALKVTVLGITKGKVKLGFEGGAVVHRLEVWERIRDVALPGGGLTP